MDDVLSYLAIAMNNALNNLLENNQLDSLSEKGLEYRLEVSRWVN